jgi:deoxyribodipyrimidine photo-lyase
LVWFRRDLRVTNHAARHHALRTARKVWCVFVCDRDILDPLPRRGRRVKLVHASLSDLDAQLSGLRAGARLLVRHGDAAEEVTALVAQLGVAAVYASHDDEPQLARRRRP